jgi:CheY-like chemotaxis protein
MLWLKFIRTWRDCPYFGIICKEILVTSLEWGRAWQADFLAMLKKMASTIDPIAFYAAVSQCCGMKQPLILVMYEKILPGSQLLNRLQDIGYDAQAISAPAELVKKAEQEKPLLLIADLEPKSAEVCQAIGQLKAHPATCHIPVIALESGRDPALLENARKAGATLVVNDRAILLHLKQFLDQALQVD